jgi:replicative DNA helicase
MFHDFYVRFHKLMYTKMQEVTCQIVKLFEYFERQGIPIKYNEPFKVPFDVQIKNENDEWVKVTHLIKKTDDRVSVKFESFDMTVGARHMFPVDDGVFMYAKDVRNERLWKQHEKVKSVEPIDYGNVYDLRVESPTHLYKTTNGVVNHNSSFVTNFIDALVEIEVPCFYFSLEMGKIDTMDRWLSIRTGIPYKEITNPQADTWYSVQKAIAAEKAKLEKHNLFRFCENASMSLNDCRKEIVRFKNETGAPYAVVVFDLLSMLRDFSGYVEGANFAQVAEIGINKLNAIAKDEGIHWVGVLQMNRSVEDARILDMKDVEKTQPQRNQIKNAGAYLERSRWVVSLWRKLYYAKMYLDEDKYAELDDVVEVSLLKSSNSEIQRRHMLFDGTTFQMTPLDD